LFLLVLLLVDMTVLLLMGMAVVDQSLLVWTVSHYNQQKP